MTSGRFPISTAVKEEAYRKILELREYGWTIPDIILLGIETAEKQVKELATKPANAH